MIVRTVLILLLIALPCCGGSSSGGGGDSGETTACSTGALFSRAPVDLADVTSQGVLGSLIPPSHTFPTPHLYMYVIDSSDPQDIEAALYAPADMKLTAIGLRHYDAVGSKTDYTDYDLEFTVCDEAKLYFIHVRSITQVDILAALEAGGCEFQSSISKTEQNCSFTVDVDVTAGEELGTVGDNEAGIYGVDVGMRDYRLATGRSAFANPDRWCSADSPDIRERCYAACFFDYLPSDTAAPYLELFSKEDGGYTITRTEDPRCGTVYLDVADSAQGYWFPSEETATTETDSLYLGPNDYLPTRHSFSTGDHVTGLDSKVYTFDVADSGMVNRGFDQITDDAVYCFDSLYDSLASLLYSPANTLDFIMLVQLAADGQSITVEKQDATASCGAGPWTFTQDAVTFYR